MFPTTHVLIAQDQLKDIGADVKVEIGGMGELSSAKSFGANMYDATSMSNSGGTGGAPDPNDFMGIIDSAQDMATGAGGGNNSRPTSTRKIDALIDQARTRARLQHPIERGEIYQRDSAHRARRRGLRLVLRAQYLADGQQARVGGFEPTAFWVFYGYTADIHKWTIEG